MKTSLLATFWISDYLVQVLVPLLILMLGEVLARLCILVGLLHGAGVRRYSHGVGPVPSYRSFPACKYAIRYRHHLLLSALPGANGRL